MMLYFCLMFSVLFHLHVHVGASNVHNQRHGKVSVENQECNITFEENTESKENLNTPAKLLYIKLNFINSTKVSRSVGNRSNLYQPLLWIQTTGSYGKGLLQLRPTYEILSLTSLTIQTEHVSIEVKDSPKDCLESMNVSNYEQTVLRFLFQQLYSKDGKTKKDEEDQNICSLHIDNDNGYADFYYECCYVDRDENIVCYRVEQNVWMKMIDICQYIVAVLAVLYCPWIIPSSLYRKKYIPSQFVYHLKDSINLKVKKTRRPIHWWNNLMRSNEYENTQKITPMSKFEGMEHFQSIIAEMACEEVHELTITKLHLKVRHNDIVPETSVPTGLLRTFYDAFIECGFRNKNDKTDCCNANVFGCLKPCGKEYPWFKCLRLLVRLLLSIVVCSPWIFRISVFYLYENDIRNSRKQAADERNLDTALNTNLIYYLTPIHVLFLMCFSVVILDSLLIGSVSKKIFLFTRTMLQECLQDMRDSSRRPVLMWTFKILTTPFRKFGIFGVVTIPLFWICTLPIVIVALLFRWFPTVNLTCALLLQFFNMLTPKCCKYCFAKSSQMYRLINYLCDTGEKQSIIEEETVREENATGTSEMFTRPVMKSFTVRLIVIIITFISLASFIVLTVECTVFFTQVAVYTTIGLILNSSHVMQYISAVSLGWLYFIKCFGGIDKLYLRYNRAIHQLIREENKSSLEKVAHLSSDVQENTAFKVRGANASPAVLDFDYETPKWTTHGVFLLMDKYDNTYLTKDFFFDSCKIDHPHCPQDLSGHILLATRRFLTIILFLMFVTCVVLAFGDVYSVSISNQLLATVAGGFVPWLLIKSDLLFPSAEEPDLDKLKESFQFTTGFKDLIESDVESWYIDDIETEVTLKTTKPLMLTQNGHDENYVLDELSKEVCPVGEALNVISNGKVDTDDSFPTDHLEMNAKYLCETEIVDLLIEDSDNHDDYKTYSSHKV